MTCVFKDDIVICKARKADIWIRYCYFLLNGSNHYVVINANTCKKEAPCVVVMRVLLCICASIATLI